MAYIEVEVFEVAGSRPKTKKALKELVKEGHELSFLSVSPFNSYAATLSQMSVGDNLTIAGPNPWSDRRWFATVSKTAKGVTVK